MKQVSKELDKKLPKAGRPRISWHWWWFKDAWRLLRAAWRERRADRLRRALYMSTRGANYRQVWIGPVTIIWSARWLEGPAQQFHPKVYADHFKDDAKE